MISLFIIHMNYRIIYDIICLLEDNPATVRKGKEARLARSG